MCKTRVEYCSPILKGVKAYGLRFFMQNTLSSQLPLKSWGGGYEAKIVHRKIAMCRCTYYKGNTVLLVFKEL
jgi:hypothetical protein